MAYYINRGRGVLVDAGSPGEQAAILAELDRHNLPPPGLIFLTHAHFDHFGSAAALQEQTGALVAIHQADAAALARAETPIGNVRGRGRWTRYLLPLADVLLRPHGVQADILLQEGQRLDEFGIQAQVVHTPGHTGGSSSLLLQSGEVFVGDVVSASGEPHLQRYYAQDWEQVADSFRKLCRLQPRLIYPGHGSPAIPGSILHTLR